MKVLIVSFDKILTESLKEAFSDHEVFIAKNSEEAIKMIPSDIDIVVYDAISGAISEEDINTLYTKKFSNSKYLILYDELFPVDMNNIIPPGKMKLPRDEDPNTIASKLAVIPAETQEAEVTYVEVPPAEVTTTGKQEIEIEPTSLVQEETQEVEVTEPELEIEPTSLDVEEVAQEAAEMLTEQVQEPLQETEVTPEAIEEPLPAVETSHETPPEEPEPAPSKESNKVLIVSFDQTLIDSIRNILGKQFQVESVKTVKQAMEKGSDALVVIFDAISGVIAEKGLIDLSNHKDMKDKPYIILVDDLFPINVEGIPLERKEAISRDIDPSRIRDLIVQLSAPVKAEEAPPEEKPVLEPVSESVQESIEEEAPEISTQEAEETLEEISAEPESQPVVEELEEVPEAEEEIPALEALGKIIEEQTKEETQPTALPASAVSSADLEAQIKEIVRKAIDEKMTEIGGLISELVRTEIEKVFGQIDIEKVIKDTAYQILKEKLEELVS